MADENKKGISTGVAVAIGLGGLAVGAIGAAAVYEMVVIPNALESAAGGDAAKKTSTTTAAK